MLTIQSLAYHSTDNNRKPRCFLIRAIPNLSLLTNLGSNQYLGVRLNEQDVVSKGDQIIRGTGALPELY